MIADNGCGPTARQLLLDFDRLGIINYIHFPSKFAEGSQLPAYKKILACARDFDGVLAIIDADEFLVPEGEKTLRPFVEKRFSDKSVSAVALNWATFGSNGALFAEDGLVIERFTRRAQQEFKPHRYIKSIVRPERVKEYGDPHFATLRQGRYVDAAGNSYNPGVNAQVLWEGVRINHYVVKSLEEFLFGKHLAGDVMTPNNVRHKNYFMSLDRNEEECLLAAQFCTPGTRRNITIKHKKSPTAVMPASHQHSTIPTPQKYSRSSVAFRPSAVSGNRWSRYRPSILAHAPRPCIRATPPAYGVQHLL